MAGMVANDMVWDIGEYNLLGVECCSLFHKEHSRLVGSYLLYRERYGKREDICGFHISTDGYISVDMNLV